VIPYLSPELIAAIVGDESATTSDMRTHSKPVVENSVPDRRSLSAVDKKSVPAPFQWNVSWARYSRLFVVAAKLILLWLAVVISGIGSNTFGSTWRVRRVRQHSVPRGTTNRTCFNSPCNLRATACTKSGHTVSLALAGS
jgi:hypothetical protein